MGMKFTKIPNDTFQKLQMNAGILVDSFNPATGVIGNLLGATTGGIEFATNPEYEDFGEDIDNCPNNMKELKRITAYDPSMSGTFLTCTAAVAKMLVGSADIDSSDNTHIIPRQTLLASDFTDVWWIGDYSDVNEDSGTGAGAQSAGFLAVHLMNALNTGGFQITSSKNAKGNLAFEFHGHYSMSAQDNVPFEIYCKAGGNGTPVATIELNKHTINLVAGGDTETLIAAVTPAGQTVTWSSSATGKASVSGGVVTPESAGSAIITASITYDGVTYTDTCTVIVASA